MTEQKETLTLINGNKQQYTVDLPNIIWMGQINEVALAHIFENTGLNFQEFGWKERHSAQPTSSDQIVKLLLTYNVKTQYYNNSSHKNTLFLKGDHHVGFDVDDICYECARRNGVHLSGLKPGDILAC